MGSSCSSRQSDKDSISTSSDENQIDAKISPSKTSKSDQTVGQDLKSNGSGGGPVGTPDSPSVTRLNSNQLISAGNSRHLKMVQMPDLSNLKDETRALVEGKTSLCSPFSPENRICICLLGTSLEPSRCLIDVEKQLHKQLVPECNSEGWEIAIVSPQISSPVYKSSHTLSHIVSHFIKDEALRNCSESRMYIVFYVDSNVTELPQMISKSKFESLITNDKKLFSKWFIHDPSLDVYRLVLPHVHFEDLQGSDRNAFAKAQENWHQEYRSLLFHLETTEDIPNVTCTNLIATELALLKEESLSNCQIKIYMEAEKDLGKLQQHFEKCISKEDVVRLPKGDDAAMKVITTPLETSIRNLIRAKESPSRTQENGINRKTLHEISEHNQRCKIIMSSKIKVKVDLDPIKQYLSQKTSSPFIICGDRGSGKSHMCSQIATECHQWNPLFHVAIRYVYLNQNSSTLEGIVYFLREHCAILYGANSMLMKLSDLGSNIRELWKKSSPERPLVVILDGLDELSPTEGSIDWLLELPQNVKMILAIQTNSPLALYLSKRIDAHQFMNFHTSRKCLQETFMSSFPKESNSSSLFEELASSTPKEVLSPLYIMILSQIIMITRDRHTPFPKSFEATIQELFIALASVFPKEYLRAILGTLSLTKSGITNSEIISISNSLSFNHSFDWLSLRILIWPLLTVRKENKVNLIGWSNDYIRSLAYQHFLGSSQQKLLCQNLLWKFITNSEENIVFNSSLWSSRQNSLAHKRSFQEASTLLEPTTNAKYFFNYDWLKEKLRLCSPFKLLDDLTSACKISGIQELNFLREAFQSSIPALIYDESQLPSQIYGRLKFTLSEEQSSNFASLLQSITSDDSIRFLPNSPCFSMLEEPKNQIHVNAIFRIPNNTNHVVALSDTHSRVQVWNIIEKTIVRTLNGINQPRNLEMIDSHKCLLLCGRELRIYNLNKGIFLMKLREVMNQKMPFFGVHNLEHVIALSRSRMYVNMMNSSEGTCVTTFKVGENRFLSSLVVSGNGKICVCGDDSQKPSALLVWDLEDRKLMYDLRIPHHEFDTKLVAITIEGHYVCSVSKENDDPAPNFIVVYDLQNGTLFKRWKPDVNIISITISTAGTCVIAGLEDSSIVAYDLITGNARWRAIGHTAPPDVFKMDERGSVVVSYDSLSKDHSIRLWNIRTGESIAGFSPDESITACEITSDGKVVILALQGRPHIIPLLLCRAGEHFPPHVKELRIYGDEQFLGKSFELSETHAGGSE